MFTIFKKGCVDVSAIKQITIKNKKNGKQI